MLNGSNALAGPSTQRLTTGDSQAEQQNPGLSANGLRVNHGSNSQNIYE